MVALSETSQEDLYWSEIDEEIERFEISSYTQEFIEGQIFYNLILYSLSMLTQISHSSKRLGKLKKYKTNMANSGYEFLLQSMER